MKKSVLIVGIIVLTIGWYLYKMTLSHPWADPMIDHKSTKVWLGSLAEEIKSFHSLCGKWPDSIAEMKSTDCVNFVERKQAIIDRDAWGKEFQFLNSPSELKVRSLGSDGAEGGSGLAEGIEFVVKK